MWPEESRYTPGESELKLDKPFKFLMLRYFLKTEWDLINHFSSFVCDLEILAFAVSSYVFI